MLRRKLVRLGKSSLVISLPKDWLRDFNLRAGDEIAILIEKNGCLKVLPPKLISQTKTNPIVINVEKCNQEKLLERLLIASYVVGRDPIIIENRLGLTEDQLNETRNVINKIRGIEIVKESPTHIVLRTFLDPTKYPLTGLLRRLTNLIRTMLEYLITAIKEKSQSYLEEIIHIEDEIDRIYFSALRQIFLAHKDETIASSIGIRSPSELLSLRMAIKMFELLADTLADLAEKGLKLQTSVFSQINEYSDLKSLLLDISTAMDTITKTLIYGNVALINELLNRIESIRFLSEKVDSFAVRKIRSMELACWVRELSWKLSSILETIRVVAEIAINMVVDKADRKFEC